jgi:hypothetical protein
MDLFPITLNLRSIMRAGSTQKSPSFSNSITVQSIMWLGSDTYLFNLMTHQKHYALSWMQEMMACMKLTLYFLIFQMAHNILLPTLGNNPILSNFFLLSL